MPDASSSPDAKMLPVLQSAVVRDGPSLSAAPVSVVRPGQYVVVLEEVTEVDGGKSSVFLRLGDGQYVSRIAARMERDGEQDLANPSSDIVPRILGFVFLLLLIGNLIWHHRKPDDPETGGGGGGAGH